MSYATTADVGGRLRNFYAKLYSDGEGGIDTDLVAEHIADAEGEIHASAAGRYETPVTAAGSLAILKNWTLTLVEELAWMNHAMGKTPENLETRVEAVRKALERLADGKLTLPGAAERATSAGGAAYVECATPVFGRNDMEGF